MQNNNEFGRWFAIVRAFLHKCWTESLNICYKCESIDIATWCQQQLNVNKKIILNMLWLYTSTISKSFMFCLWYFKRFSCNIALQFRLIWDKILWTGFDVKCIGTNLSLQSKWHSNGKCGMHQCGMLFTARKLIVKMNKRNVSQKYARIQWICCWQDRCWVNFLNPFTLTQHILFSLSVHYIHFCSFLP